MKYVLLGNLSPEWASKQSERVGKAKAKLDKLGIKVESIHYTQGYYDFVDVVDAPKPEALLAFSVWYSNQALGRIQSMPAFEAKTVETAIKDATDRVPDGQSTVRVERMQLEGIETGNLAAAQPDPQTA